MSVGIAHIGVVDGMTVVAAQTDAQTGQRIVVDTGTHTILIGGLKLKGIFGAIVDPSLTVELQRIETG